MSQQTPKADQLRALREAKFSKRGKDAQTSGAVRKSGSDSIGGVSAVVQHRTSGASKKKVAAAGKKVGAKAAKRGKKQTARKQGPTYL